MKIFVYAFTILLLVGVVYNEFFYMSEEEIQEQKKIEEIKKEKERQTKIEEQAAKIQREVDKKERKKQEKLDFISSLGKNAQNIENINYKELALKHIKETELQNDQTEKRLMGKFIRVTGKVSDIDSKGDEYGIPEFMIQLKEGKELYGTIIDGLYVTATCYSTNENEQNKITNASIGSTLTIVGKVRSYGDMGGLILNKCTVE